MAKRELVATPKGNYITVSSDDMKFNDDNGVKIPLGERDNFGINDIRYGLLPFAGITGTATLHNKSNK